MMGRSCSRCITLTWISAMCLRSRTIFSASYDRTVKVCRLCVSRRWLHCHNHLPRLLINYLTHRHTSISDKGLASLLEKCPRLQLLDIGNSKRITDQSLLILPTCIIWMIPSRLDTPLLSSLTLDNDDISDEGLSTVVTNLPLTYLSIAFCSNITGKCFAMLNFLMNRSIVFKCPQQFS